ncbi:shugoshin_C domain-containing protein [Caerostris darwini]|uniref:Shugoshin_C domain-containing protein n=1 Tax=Caerostris darwini TaxID=1538125 RepID=A0AAV4W5D1_9ARAC|nr:shugoshin_C domain-containing protein [Caerostris darwini]
MKSSKSLHKIESAIPIAENNDAAAFVNSEKMGHSSDCNKFKKKTAKKVRYSKKNVNNLSQNVLNQSVIYKNRIKSLEKNNRNLALALQHKRILETEKQNLLVANLKYVNIMNLSRSKVMDVVTSLKNATEYLNEIVVLLNLHAIEDQSELTSNNAIYRDDLRQQLKKLNISPIKEVEEAVSENENSNELFKTCEIADSKGEKTLFEGKASALNKKIIKKKTKTSSKNSKSSPNSSSRQTTSKQKKIPSKTFKPSSSDNSRNTTSNNFQEVDSAPSIASKKQLMLAETSSNHESILNSKLSSNSEKSLQKKSLRKISSKNWVVLNHNKVHESFDAENLILENSNSALQNQLEKEVSCENINKTPDLPKNSDETEDISKTIIDISHMIEHNKQSPSKKIVHLDNRICPLVENISENFSNNTDNFNNQLPFGDVPTVNKSSLISLKNVSIDSLCDPIVNETTESNHSEKALNRSKKKAKLVKKVESSKNAKYRKVSNLKSRNNVQSYCEDDSIEKIKKIGNSRIRKRSTVGKKKCSIPLKKTPLNSNREILDNVKEIKKDTFLVTAEVHCSLDDGASKEKSNSVESVAQDIQPTVVLMDIFKSKVASDYLKENEHLIKEISKNLLK